MRPKTGRSQATESDNQPPMKRLLTSPGYLLGAIIALALTGCNTTYEMEVDAITNPTMTDADSYIIVPRDPETDVNDLRYKETVNYIKTALSGKGMYEALNAQDADMIIEVDYGMEPPRREYKVVEEPVFATIQQPDSIQTVTQRDPATGRMITYTVRVPGARSRELIGYQERLIAVIVNEKYMELTAKENLLEATGDVPAQEIWSVRVKNYDESDDLREYLPIMAASVADYVGEDTGTNHSVRLKEKDEVVQFIKRGINKKPENANLLVKESEKTSI